MQRREAKIGLRDRKCLQSGRRSFSTGYRSRAAARRSRGMEPTVRNPRIKSAIGFRSRATIPVVKAAIEGRLPRGIGVERLRDAPAEWSQQFETLGLNPQ